MPLKLEYWEVQEELGGFEVREIKPDYVLIINSVTKEEKKLPIFKHTREEMFLLIEKKIISKLKKCSPNTIYKHFKQLNNFVYTEYEKTRLRNYEIEGDFFILYKTYGHYIDEPCPFNGVYSSYFYLNNLI